MTPGDDERNGTDRKKLTGLAGVNAASSRGEDDRTRTADRLRAAGADEGELDDPGADPATAVDSEPVVGTSLFTDGGEASALAMAVPSTYKVRGELSSPGATGVFGYNSASSGSGIGVLGQVDSQGDGATGVKGIAPDSSTGLTYGVQGITEGKGDIEGSIPIGVNGEARGSGTTYGVRGYTASSDLEAAAVYANAPNGATGIDVETATGRAIEASRGDNSGSAIYGIGGNYGVVSGNDAQVIGALDIRDSSISVYMDTLSEQSFPDGTVERVHYDSTTTDDWNVSLEETTGEITIPRDGDYYVSAQVALRKQLSSGDTMRIELREAGTVLAETFRVAGAGSSSNPQSISVGKLLTGLTENNILDVRFEQTSGGSAQARGNARHTYLTLNRVG